jgi:DNA primase
MSSVQAQLIKDHCDEVVLFLDDDLAGHNAVLGVDQEDGEHKPGIIEILEPFVKVKLVGKHRYDPNEYLCKGNENRIHKLIAEAIPSFKLNL